MGDCLFCLFWFYSDAGVVIDLASRRANLLGIVEVPGDRKLCLTPLAAARFGGDVEPAEALVLRERLTPGTSLSGQGVSGFDADGDLPGGCLSHLRRSALQPGTACQERSAADSLKARARRAFFGGFLSSGLEAGDRTRTGDVQLGKLTFYH
jgi:hypothetical protein